MRRLLLLAATALAIPSLAFGQVSQTGYVTGPAGQTLSLLPTTQFNQSCNGGAGGIVGQLGTVSPYLSTVCGPASGTVIIAAGSANIGKVGIDQTTPGTTNGVQVNAALPAGSNTIGAVTQSGNWNVGGLTGIGNTGSITRASNTTAYAANQLICLFTSTTVCAPIQVTVSGASAATGTMGRVTLEKTGTSLTNAQFTIYFFSAAPTLTSKYDASAYAGPFAADITSGVYLGSYTCNAMQATADGTAQAFSECTPTAGQGWTQYKTLAGQNYVDAVITATAAYTPTSAEVFTITANSYQDK